MNIEDESGVDMFSTQGSQVSQGHNQVDSGPQSQLPSQGHSGPCGRVLQRDKSRSTKNLIRHLATKHHIVAPDKSQLVPNTNGPSKRSWVWNYFTVDPDDTFKVICNAVVSDNRRFGNVPTGEGTLLSFSRHLEQAHRFKRSEIGHSSWIWVLFEEHPKDPTLLRCRACGATFSKDETVPTRYINSEIAFGAKPKKHRKSSGVTTITPQHKTKPPHSTSLVRKEHPNGGNSDESPIKKSRKRSWVWNYFHKSVDDRVRCIAPSVNGDGPCGCSMSYDHSKSTKNFIRHLNNVHKIYGNENHNNNGSNQSTGSTDHVNVPSSSVVVTSSSQSNNNNSNNDLMDSSIYDDDHTDSNIFATVQNDVLNGSFPLSYTQMIPQTANGPGLPRLLNDNGNQSIADDHSSVNGLSQPSTVYNSVRPYNAYSDASTQRIYASPMSHPNRYSWVWRYFMDFPDDPSKAYCKVTKESGDICGVLMSKDKTGSTRKLSRHLIRKHGLQPEERLRVLE